MKDLTNCKIWIGDNPELSEKVQNRLFELGYFWQNGTTNIYKNYRSIYIDKKCLSTSMTKEYFEKQSNKEIFLSDLFEEENWKPKVGETWKYTNNVWNYFINSIHSNGTKVKMTRTDTNQIISEYSIEPFKNINLWKKISSNQEEDLSKVPYIEWRVGDIITPFQNWNDNGGLTANKEYVITKFRNNDPYVIKNDGKEDWSKYTCFKLVKRVNQSIIQDDFVLPEKWYVNSNIKEERIKIGKWFDDKEGCSEKNFYENQARNQLSRFKGYKYPFTKGYVYDSVCPKDYTSITFEQFEQYVLKQSSQISIIDFSGSIKQTNNNLNKQKNGTKTENTKFEVRRSNFSFPRTEGSNKNSIDCTKSKKSFRFNNCSVTIGSF